MAWRLGALDTVATPVLAHVAADVNLRPAATYALEHQPDADEEAEALKTHVEVAEAIRIGRTRVATHPPLT